MSADTVYQDLRHLNGDLADGKYFFVVGPDQQLYAAHEILSGMYKDRSRQMRHSSFFGGGDVPDAAAFFLKNGKFEILNDDSGHYKPGFKEFLRTVKKLKQMRAPIDSSTLFTFRVVGDKSEFPRSIRVDYESLENLDSMMDLTEVSIFQAIIKKQVQRISSEVSNINSLMSAYLVAGKVADSFVVEHLPPVIDMNLEFPGDFKSIINNTIGRRSFYNALAQKGPEGVLAMKKWLSRLVEIKWIKKETVESEIEDIQQIPDIFMDQDSKNSLIGLLKTVK